MTEKTVVVAGATGYLGGHVARALGAAGYRVRALARDASRLSPEVRSACAEIVVAEATRPDTYGALFEGADLAFSSIGIRHFHRRPTFWEIDRDANLALVAAAKAAGVETFVFTSVFRGDELRERLAIADARETVVDALRVSEMRTIVLRPTGFFNDMGDFFGMAKNGRAWLLGDGSTRINPIHAADIATELVRRLAERGDERMIAVPLGGPDVYTLKEIAELAFRALDAPSRFASLPVSVAYGLAAIARPFNVNVGAILAAAASMCEVDGVAPAVGSHHLVDFFEELTKR